MKLSNMFKRRKNLFSIVLTVVMIFNASLSMSVFAKSVDTVLFDENIQKEIGLSDKKYQEDYDIMIENELNGGSNTKSIDQMLLKSQQWLNLNYSNKTGFGSIPEDGTSRRSTVYGCIRALQIELGITATADNFGTGTISRFNTKYPNGISQQDYPSDVEDNVYGIIQCALWTKGYSTGANIISKHFYDGTGNALKELKSDMGFINSDSTVTLNVMKGLLSMNYYVTVSGGTEEIRKIQQQLNRTYPEYLGIIPCDGIYTRSMNKALIKVLQAIEEYEPEDATGNFGSGTKSKLDQYVYLPQNANNTEVINLLRYCLICNGYSGSINLDENAVWNEDIKSLVLSFREDMCLPIKYEVDTDMWMALLLSKGNPDRSANACDTRFEMTDERIEYLINNNYEIVGRYLTGSSKGLKDDEPKRILDAGLSFFPIFQETLYTDTISKYNSSLGVADVNKATSRAEELGIPKDSLIYYAIDFDPTDEEIQSYVIPYFKSIYQNRGDYRVGIYGTRNVCTQIMNLKYAETCFVSDMSTGYSGNMGFKMPLNWNLDQFNEYTVTTASGSWDIDKVIYAGKFPVVGNLSHFKLEGFEITGTKVGKSFMPSNGAKKLRYTISWESDNSMNLLYVNFYKQSYYPESQLIENELKDNINLAYYNNSHHTFTSDWIEVSDKVGYFFQYECKDESKPIGTPPPMGVEINRPLEDGTCNLEMYIEYQY